MRFANGPLGSNLNNSDFMKVVAADMNGYLQYGNYSLYTAGFSVTASAFSVSGHNSVGNSVNISGLVTSVLISESIGSTNMPNVTMTWNDGFVMFHPHVPGAVTAVFTGNGIARSHAQGVNMPPDIGIPNKPNP